MYRHKDYAAMRDLAEEDPTEVEAGKYNLNYVQLDGNVGCMVNGAGLAMATMDIIKLAGGEPANFLDVGGTANAETVANAFRIILKDEKVKAILVNIFGGIVRCDRVANGIVDAYKQIGDIKVPIIVRLQGTNAVEAKQIIDNSGLKVFSAILLKDAADLVTQVLGRSKELTLPHGTEKARFCRVFFWSICGPRKFTCLACRLTLRWSRVARLPRKNMHRHVCFRAEGAKTVHWSIATHLTADVGPLSVAQRPY